MKFKIENLNIKINKFKLKNISMDISDDDYYVLLGSTGSGKSTLLKSILGLYNIDTGKISLNQKEIQELPVELRKIGYLPQHYALFPHLNVIENILYGVRNSNDIRNTENIIKLLKIDHLLNRQIEGLSGGEKQKTALARCLAIKPNLMLLDEPFSAIDQGSKRILWFEIKQILKKMKIPVIHVTHNLEEAYSLSEKIGVIINGHLIQTGQKEEIFEKPKNVEIARLLNYRNIFNGMIVENKNGLIKIKTDNFNLILKRTFNNKKEITFCIRQQDIKIIKEGYPVKQELGNNMFEGTIISEIFYPNTISIFFKIQNSNKEYDFEINFPAYIYKRYGLKTGKTIRVAFWEPNIIVF